MSIICCDVQETTLDGDYCDDCVPAVVVTCGQCGHETESYGTSERSVRRCLALMREQCPQGKRGYYSADCR